MEHILLVLFVCKIINVFRCGRGVFGWSFLVGFASGVGGRGGVVLCVFPLCCNFCVYAGFQSRVRVNSVKCFNSLAPFTDRCACFGV